MDKGIFLVSFEFGVNQCTSCHVTQQNVNFTKIVFSQSILKIDTSEWEEEIDKIHAHILVTLFSQIVTLLVIGHDKTWINCDF